MSKHPQPAEGAMWALPTDAVRLPGGAYAFRAFNGEIVVLNEELSGAFLQGSRLGSPSLGGIQLLPASEVARTGASLVPAQLLISPQTLVEELASESEHPPAPLKTLVIPTKGRPSAIGRLLAQLEVVFRRTPEPYELMVVEDGSGPASDETERLVRGLRRHSGLPVVFHGYRERQALLDRLCDAASVDATTADFLLSGRHAGRDGDPTYGAALNYALLATAGRPVAFLDDDMLPEVGVPLDAELDRLSVCPDFDPTRLQVCRDFGDALKSVTWEPNVDYLSVHRCYLGASLSRAFLRASSVSCAPGVSKLLRHPRRQPKRIVATTLGTVGDCGLWSLHGFLHLSNQDLVEFTRTQESFKTLAHSRNVVRYVSAPSINGGGFITNAALGLDNRGCLPAFMPSFRSMDHVFSTCLAVLHDADYQLFLPQVVVHAPIDARSGLGQSPQNAAVIRVCDVMVRLVRETGLADIEGDPTDKLGALGEVLIALASRESRLFQNSMDGLSRRILWARLQSVRQKFEAIERLWPERTWLLDGIQAHQQQLIQALRASEIGVMEYQAERVMNWNGLREYIRSVGQGWVAWPSLWEAARRHNAAASISPN